MLRVSEVWERALHTPQLAITAPGEVIIIRAAGQYEGKQGMSLATGVSSRSAGARALCLHLVMIPPGTRGVPHVHDGHESAIYTVSGETEVWHGEGLRQCSVVKAGDFMYVPPGTPHLPVNRSDVMTIAVVARTDPQEQESVVTLSLPPHLAELNAFPIASPDIPA
ncbi:MAG: cupin domain-containing protein [Streptosporangiaceae bacterium]